MARFQKLLSRIFGAFSRSPSVPAKLSKDENVTRYVFDPGYIRRTQPKPTAKFQVFLPHNRETSVFRISYLSELEIWELGNNQVASLRKRRIKARADVEVGTIENIGTEKGFADLTVVPETSTHHLHANIVGWPEDESALQMVAVELANKAKVYFSPMVNPGVIISS